MYEPIKSLWQKKNSSMYPAIIVKANTDNRQNLLKAAVSNFNCSYSLNENYSWAWCEVDPTNHHNIWAIDSYWAVTILRNSEAAEVHPHLSRCLSNDPHVLSQVYTLTDAVGTLSDGDGDTAICSVEDCGIQS